MKTKLRYDRGDLVSVVKSTHAKPGALDELKPPMNGAWSIPIDRKDLLMVFRHEEGGGTAKFKGSLLVLSRAGIVWIDSRNVTLVREKGD